MKSLAHGVGVYRNAASVNRVCSHRRVRSSGRWLLEVKGDKKAKVLLPVFGESTSDMSFRDVYRLQS